MSVIPMAAAARAASRSWVATWASAQQLVEPGNMPPPPGLADTTLRQVVHLSVGGGRLRVRFSNAFGKEPLTVASAHVALPDGPGTIRTASDRPLSFGGRPGTTIAPGTSAVSDPVDFAVESLSDLAVTIHVIDPSADVTGHPGSRCTSYLAAGDAVSAARLPGVAETEHWYYLAGVDVLADAPSEAVAILGDSLTDGRGSITDGNTRWPDYLARRLQEDRTTRRVTVINSGIGGNRVLHDGLGPSGLSRLDRDVFAHDGVRWLIVFEGVNDIGTRSASAGGLVDGYRKIVDQAHARGLAVVGATLTPFGGSFYDHPETAAVRDAVNRWIRTPGHFDAVVDFDAAVRDPATPDRLRSEADSGDHLHLTPAGYRMLADAVDLGLFRPR